MTGLSAAQWRVLRDAAGRRPIAGNDDGWVSLFGCPRPTVWALVRRGMLEALHKGPTTSGAQLHRVTLAGRQALANAPPAVEE